MASLETIALLDLVNEIRRRSKCSLVVCGLKESSKEANVRQYVQADKGAGLQLLAIVDLAHGEVRRHVRTEHMGEEVEG